MEILSSPRLASLNHSTFQWHVRLPYMKRSDKKNWQDISNNKCYPMNNTRIYLTNGNMGMMSECMIPAKDIFIKAVLALLCLFTLSNPLKAQQIKKIKIDELQSYIEKSDHPLIVNFWATYCVPCVQEIPYFQKHAEKFKKQGLELLLVSLDLPDYY